jgi:aminoglycoside phosphotransferase (APT) family kinase protein
MDDGSLIVYRLSSIVKFMLPAPILNLLQAACPGQPIGDFAATTGGFSNLTAIVTIGARRCVIKAAATTLKRADVRHEATMLRLLQGSDLPFPSLLALVEDDRWTIAVTRWVAGEHGLVVLERAPEQLESLYRALGLLLAKVHRTPLAAPAPAPQLEDRMRHALACLPALELESDLSAALLEGLEHPIWRAQPHGLAHGDAGLHNLLWDGRITALLDWEWAGWGTPLLDLAWLYWTIQWRGLPSALWQSLLAGYGAGPALAIGAAPDELRALALGQIASILARAQGQPSAWEEWQRRLRWTIGLAFVGLEGG